MLLAGEGRLHAARLLNLRSIPAIVMEGLTDAKKRALVLADNRIAQSGGWDRERLASELANLPELLVEDDLDITITGFEPAEIDALLADFEMTVQIPPTMSILLIPRVRRLLSGMTFGNSATTAFCVGTHEMSLT